MANPPILLFLTLAFFSCSKPEGTRQEASGLPGEVVVILDQQSWDSRLGDTIRHFLEKPKPGLEQPEPSFHIGQYDPQAFNDAVKAHRNIILFQIGGTVSPRAAYEQDRWADNQTLITLEAGDVGKALELFSREALQIIRHLDSAEQQRIIRKNQQQPSPYQETLREAHHISLIIPADFKRMQEQERLYFTRDRIRYANGEAHDVDEGIFIYEYPHPGDSLPAPDQLLQKRDSVYLLHHTNTAEIPQVPYDSTLSVQFLQTAFAGRSAVEIRGTYRTENGLYNGPFVSLAIHDREKQRVLAIEGFVYAPKFLKREYLREVEAICYSLSFD